MAPDAAECCAISHHSRAARQSPRGCGGGSCAPSCAVGGTAQSAGPAQPIAHRSKRHNQFHLSWSQYWDRHQELTGPKIHTLVDAFGNPVGFHLTGGEAHDLVGADHLLPDMQAKALIADKAFDAAKRVIAPLTAAGKTVVIPPKSNRRSPRTYDRDLYKARHLIENFFARLKQFRAIATRYDKTARNFLAAVYLAASVVWLN